MPRICEIAKIVWHKLDSDKCLLQLRDVYDPSSEKTAIRVALKASLHVWAGHVWCCDFDVLQRKS